MVLYISGAEILSSKLKSINPTGAGGDLVELFLKFPYDKIDTPSGWGKNMSLTHRTLSEAFIRAPGEEGITKMEFYENGKVVIRGIKLADIPVTPQFGYDFFQPSEGIADSLQIDADRAQDGDNENTGVGAFPFHRACDFLLKYGWV